MSKYKQYTREKMRNKTQYTAKTRITHKIMLGVVTQELKQHVFRARSRGQQPRKVLVVVVCNNHAQQRRTEGRKHRNASKMQQKHEFAKPRPNRTIHCVNPSEPSVNTSPGAGICSRTQQYSAHRTPRTRKNNKTIEFETYFGRTRRAD